MLLRNFLLLLILALAGTAQAQCVEWARSYGGPNGDGATHGDETVSFVATDDSGNVYVAAKIWPGSTLAGYTAPNYRGPGASIALARLDSLGNPVWTKILGTDNNRDYEKAYGLKVQNGKVYLLMEMPARYGPFSSSWIDTDSTYSSQKDEMVLVCYSASGTFQWTTRFTSLYFSHALEIASDGALFVQGRRRPPGTGIGGYCIVKFTPTGRQLWLKEIVDSLTSINTAATGFLIKGSRLFVGVRTSNAGLNSFQLMGQTVTNDWPSKYYSAIAVADTSLTGPVTLGTIHSRGLSSLAEIVEGPNNTVYIRVGQQDTIKVDGRKLPKRGDYTFNLVKLDDRTFSYLGSLSQSNFGKPYGASVFSYNRQKQELNYASAVTGGSTYNGALYGAPTSNDYLVHTLDTNFNILQSRWLNTVTSDPSSFWSIASYKDNIYLGGQMGGRLTWDGTGTTTYYGGMTDGVVVRLRAAPGCPTVSSTHELVAAAPAVQAWPNPFSSSLTLSASGQLRLFNAAGAVVYDSAVSANEPVQLPELPAGLYQYLLQTETGFVSGRLVRE